MNNIQKYGNVAASMFNFLIDNIEATSSEEESADEEEIATVLSVLNENKNVEKKTTVRILFYMEATVGDYTEQQFQQHFRLSRPAYKVLVVKLGPKLLRKGNIGRKTISTEKQLLSVLWVFATPDSYRSVANKFNMGKSSLAV
ncbi:dna-directed rna polymerases i ii and iii subunit rpabc2 [Holotrichia oblita]|uniref:Dna-directed rna polymerases i ii and iii subunit rpabc2 n=1 Tax=Holotrichia oblita TaxID=644536 RepID=A0ACB9SK81_HOLOL|nr:dna-directed rna polymerases i ii and iii subunit rpabc2 [Holotrichia oblita]